MSYRKQYPLDDILLLSVEELEKLFLYQYDNRALRYLFSLGMGYHEAKDSLDAIAWIKLDKAYKSKKLLKLQEIAKKLAELGYIYKDEYAARTFIDRNILIDGYADTTRISRALDNVPSIAMDILSPSMIGEAPIKDEYPDIHRFSNIYGEMHYLCNKIAEDIDHGTSPEDILIYGYNEEYRLILEEMSLAYGFRINFPSSLSIYETPYGKDFLGRLSLLERWDLDAINTCLNDYASLSSVEHPCFQRLSFIIMNLFTEGVDKEKMMEIYVSALKEEKVKEDVYEGAVNLLNDYYVIPNAHIYCIDFNLNNAPTVYSDNEFLFDEEKEELFMPTSKIRNLEAKRNLLAFLHKQEICLVTYSIRHLNNEKNPSCLIAPSKEKRSSFSPLTYAEDSSLGFEYSPSFATVYATHLQDQEELYGEHSPYLGYLKMQGYLLPPYSNEFTYFEEAKKEAGKVFLSASSLDTYFKCPFHYYLEKILKINDFESTFSALIGTIFHDVLYRYYQSDFELDKAYIEAIKTQETLKNAPFSKKEMVILDNLKPRLQEVIDFLAHHHQNMLPKKEKDIPPTYLCEYSTKKEGDSYDMGVLVEDDIYLRGSIDKVILSHKLSQTYATFIDYKTYAKTFKPLTLQLGFSLQLPLYAYLSTLLPEFKDIKTLGLFIAPILPSAVYGSRDNLEKTRRNGLRLDGIFIDDEVGLSSLDCDYMDSDIVKGLKITQKGGFSANNKNAVDEETMAGYIEIAKKKILEAGEKIRAGEYPIRPTSVVNGEDACKYCNFKDVCYLRFEQKHIVRNVELGGEENADAD